MSAAAHTPSRVLVVEDTPIIRRLIVDQVSKLGYSVAEAENGRIGMDSMRATPPDAVILDLMMPEMSGIEVLAAMREDETLKDIPVIVVTALSDMDKIIYCIEHGADDYMMKPFRAPILKARLNAVIERKKLHDRERELQRQLAEYNAQLEARVRAQVKEITAAQTSAIFAMCKLSESRDVDTGAHLERVREYCRLMARQLRVDAEGEALIPESFIDDIFYASPLHDIGKVGIPDAILQKPGKHTPEEFERMKKHSEIGAAILRDVESRHPSNSFIRMGVDIAMSHHEKWDGTGYPQGLRGERIPLSARIMAVADVYDALTHARCYKPAFTHVDSAKILREGSGGHFDPKLLDLFNRLESDFIRILNELP